MREYARDFADYQAEEFSFNTSGVALTHLG